MQVALIERRKSGIELTEQGEEIVRRGRTTLPQCAMCSITPSIASVCCRERSSSGPFRQSRPISCRRHCPSCNGVPRISLCTSARRSPRRLFGSWSAAISTWFSLRFPSRVTRSRRSLSSATSSSLRRAPARASAPRRPTCLRMSGCCCSRRAIACDQALSFCRLVTPAARESFGASSLATIVQSVAHGYGIILLPEMAVASGVTFACCISLRRSQNARSGSPGDLAAQGGLSGSARLLKDVTRRPAKLRVMGRKTCSPSFAARFRSPGRSRESVRRHRSWHGPSARLRSA